MSGATAIRKKCCCTTSPCPCSGIPQPTLTITVTCDPANPDCEQFAGEYTRVEPVYQESGLCWYQYDGENGYVNLVYDPAMETWTAVLIEWVDESFHQVSEEVTVTMTCAGGQITGSGEAAGIDRGDFSCSTCTFTFVWGS